MTILRTQFYRQASRTRQSLPKRNHRYNPPILNPLCSGRYASTHSSPTLSSTAESIAKASSTNDASCENSSPPPATPSHAQLLRSTATATYHISGHVQSIRKQKRIAFAQISDGSSFQSLQCVMQPDLATLIRNGSFISAAGTWQPSQGKGQTMEFHIDSLLENPETDVEGSPLQKKEMSHDHLRQHPHMRLRLPAYALQARLRSTVVQHLHAAHAALTYVQPPVITSSDCEGAGEVFTVSPKLKIPPQEVGDLDHYFREPKYLTVSSQLHLESYSAALGDVWTLTPAFRAEESDTGRHLAELWMLEFEYRNVTNNQLMTHVQDIITHIVQHIKSGPIADELRAWHREGPVDLETRWGVLSTDQPWQRISYADAIEQVTAAAARDTTLFSAVPSWESGLALEHEKWLASEVSGDRPIFVERFPKAVKPFYMATEADVAENFDLLLPFGIGEVAGGSVREADLDKLLVNMREKGLLKVKDHVKSRTKDPEWPQLQDGESLGSLKWYAELRRFGTQRHGGFGIGFDRLLMYLTGVANVREIIPFPRTFKNCFA